MPSGKTHTRIDLFLLVIIIGIGACFWAPSSNTSDAMKWSNTELFLWLPTYLAHFYYRPIWT